MLLVFKATLSKWETSLSRRPKSRIVKRQPIEFGCIKTHCLQLLIDKLYQENNWVFIHAHNPSKGF